MQTKETNCAIEPAAGTAAHIRGAWSGRVSGCMLGKPLEVLSFREGRSGLRAYLERAGAWPLRQYVPLLADSDFQPAAARACRDEMERAEPDDDINYTVLTLMLLEAHGTGLDTEDVARAWLDRLPAGATWTAEREAYRILLERMDPEFVNGAPPGFDLSACSSHQYSDWIGAQIRADLYGWVLPGNPALASDLARRDAVLTHRDEGVHGAVFIAALGAAVPQSDGFDDAIESALAYVPADSGVSRAARFGRAVAGATDAADRLYAEYGDLSPVHVINNLALVAWALCSAGEDFGAAIGETVAAGWDTDSNAATVGGLLGLAGWQVGREWTAPWNGRIAVTLAGTGELSLDELTARTVTLIDRLATCEQRATGS